MLNDLRIKKAYTEPEIVADEMTEKLEKFLASTRPTQKIRNSQILTALMGAIGLALFIIGVEKVFSFLPGGFSILVGLLLLAVSGALLKKL